MPDEAVCSPMTGTMFYAGIMAILSSLAVVFSFAEAVRINVFHIPTYLDGYRPYNDTMELPTSVPPPIIISPNLFLICVAIFSLLNTTFSVVLFIGATEKKVTYLKAYISYGFIKLVIELISSVTVVMWSDVTIIGFTIFCFVFNAVMLLMVCNAYKKVNNPNMG